MWASAELPACSCLLFHRDGRKRWAERYTGGGDKAVEGRGRWGQAGRRTQMAGRERKGQRRGTRSESAVIQRSGALPRWPSCREEGWALPELSPPLALLLGSPSRRGLHAAAAHAYAICCYICSRPVIPLQPCGFSLCRKGLPKRLQKWTKSSSYVKLLKIKKSLLYLTGLNKGCNSPFK